MQDPAGAATALVAGATRVELCAALELGGLTPSAATIGATRDLTGRGGWLQVLVRPRAGGYVYTAAELQVARDDVAAAVAAGADGVVVGALTTRGEVDETALRALVDAASGRTVTFHRALDVVADRAAALEVLVAAGVSRVLTSCGAERAVDAVAELGDLVAAAAGRIEVMAGGGVQASHVPSLDAAGVDAVHLSARTPVPDAGGSGGTGLVWRTDGDLVTAAMRAARADPGQMLPV